MEYIFQIIAVSTTPAIFFQQDISKYQSQSSRISKLLGKKYMKYRYEYLSFSLSFT